jgi:AcrR family transcriptional regulator
MMKAGSDRKRQILEVAKRLFSRSGFDKVTTRELAEACGVSEPALYRYFDSKEAIYDAVLDSIKSHVDIEKAFAGISDEKDIESILKKLATHILEHAYKDDAMNRLLFYSALQGHQKARQVYQIIRGSYVKYLQKRLDGLFEDGLIIKKDNEITARCFIGMVFDCALSQTLWKGMLGRKFGSDQVIANNIPIYVRGLTTDIQ